MKVIANTYHENGRLVGQEYILMILLCSAYAAALGPFALHISNPTTQQAVLSDTLTHLRQLTHALPQQ
jgi:hypothetical protein